MATHPARLALASLVAAAALGGGCHCTGGTTTSDTATDSSGSDGGGASTDGGGAATDGGGSGTDGGLSTDAGGGAVCGGFTGATCAATEYCDYPDGACGAADGSGTCQPRPTGCDTVFDPVCACDGTVYDNDCIAAAAGVDVSTLGNCTPPPGDFSCGSRFCTLGAQYCYHLIDDTGMPDTWTCMPMPPCMTADCACVNAAPPCAGTCADGTDGSVTLTCGAG
ncbi:MAG TPA: hypothetical protein VG389_21675 [Myxococcota bacterium]|jgi:hypothetical protein|nr:hypothetical protein [Myxococcota bacterium]